MRIGFVGLGKMGAQIVSKLLDAGHEVVATDVNPAAVQAAVQAGALGAMSREELVNQLEGEKVIWLMIPDAFVETEVNAYRELLGAGDILIDGGNSRYTDTIRRGEGLAEKNVHYVDVGTSGGILGLENGFSMMVGGDKGAVEKLQPILNVLSEPSGAVTYMGPSGYGHYVKMVHNAVEYGMMQSYAEGFSLMKNGPLENIDLAAVAHVWQKGSIVSSQLNELITEILATNPDLTGIDGFVADSGEGRWTSETAQTAHIPMPALNSALETRFRSQNGETDYSTKLLAAMRNKFGGHAINKNESKTNGA